MLTGINATTFYIRTPNGTLYYQRYILAENNYINNTYLNPFLLETIENNIFLPFDKHTVKLLIPFIREGRITVKRRTTNKSELASLLQHISKDCGKCEEMILQLNNGRMDKYGFKIISDDKDKNVTVYDINKYPKIKNYSKRESSVRQAFIIDIVIKEMKKRFREVLLKRFRSEKHSLWNKLYNSVFNIQNNNDDINDEIFHFNKYMDNFFGNIQITLATKKSIADKIKKFYNINETDNRETDICKYIFNEMNDEPSEMYGLCNGTVYLYFSGLFIDSYDYDKLTGSDFEMSNVIHVLFDIPVSRAFYTAQEIYGTIESELSKKYNN